MHHEQKIKKKAEIDKKVERLGKLLGKSKRRVYMYLAGAGMKLETARTASRVMGYHAIFWVQDGNEALKREAFNGADI